MQLYPYIRLRMLIFFFNTLGSLWHNVLSAVCSFSLYLYSYIIISDSACAHECRCVIIYGSPFYVSLFSYTWILFEAMGKSTSCCFYKYFHKMFIYNEFQLQGYWWLKVKGKEKTTGANDFAILFLIRYFLWTTSTIIYSSCQYTSASRIFAKIS